MATGAGLKPITMIGVIAKTSDRSVVREFFELFKTPWEEYRPERSYDVILMCEAETIPSPPARLLVHYSTSESSTDASVKVGHCIDGRNLSYKGWQVPIYGASVTFPEVAPLFLKEEASEVAAGYQGQIQGIRYCRIGYDLLAEIRTLLACGQPPERASIPTVELHIAILRDLIIEAGVTFAEIPPIPQGYTFVACLTHDVDHPGMRFHRWDHTMLGFFYRAIWGSLVQWLKGRRPVSHLVKNYAAAVKAPFVLLGFAKDDWQDFWRYTELEGGSPSTFFVLPFRGRPGRTVSGPAPGMRASGYGATDIADNVMVLRTSGVEIGLHGIDAWIDSAKGEEERAEIANLAEGMCHGVRMHWLYFRDDSYETLEKAGFTYDSTVGYNQTIGYRAGTTQVYKPLQVNRLMELPLHVMDTALFYPAYMNLSFEEAGKKIGELIESAIQFGGVLTFNWHDRSIAPERCWGEFYEELVRTLKQKGAWCTSANRTVCWFANRRAVSFRRSDQGIEIVTNIPNAEYSNELPGLRIRVYNLAWRENQRHAAFVDTPIQGDMSVALVMNGWPEAEAHVPEAHL